MQRCKEDIKVEEPEFPKVKASDTVENCDDVVYLVCTAPNRQTLYLQSLSHGTIWSMNSLWGAYANHKRWKKVNYCFKRVEEC